MTTAPEQFITQMKLRELRKQRSLLLTAYDALDQSLKSATSDFSKLNTLYHGLREIKFAGHSLHPDVTNLEPILNNGSTNASADTVSFWRNRLEKELSTGRLRSEIVFIFASLLEEWTAETASPTPDPQSSQIRRSLLDQIIRPVTERPVFNPDFMDKLFAGLDFDQPEINEILQKKIKLLVEAKIEPLEVMEVLRKISRDRYHSPLSRKQAKNLLHDYAVIKEFADALSIILAELENWQWAETGVTVRACLTPSKWRLFLNEDLATACL
jgi:hypothetical protein